MCQSLCVCVRRCACQHCFRAIRGGVVILVMPAACTYISSQVGRQHSCQFQIPPFLAAVWMAQQAAPPRTGPVWGSSWVLVCFRGWLDWVLEDPSASHFLRESQMSWEKACCVLGPLCKRQECSRWSGAAASHSKRNHKAQPPLRRNRKLGPGRGRLAEVSLRGHLYLEFV